MAHDHRRVRTVDAGAVGVNWGVGTINSAMARPRGRRSRARGVLGFVAAVCAVLMLSIAPAQAAQHQDANEHAIWNFHGANGFWNIDQRVQITQKANHSYWAMMWDFTATPGNGGYMGLQTDGTRFNHTTGETAIFSLWNANASRGSCGPFDGEGTGLSCRLAYPIDRQTDYRLRVWRLNADAGGQWWGAWIRNMRTGVDTAIGRLRVPRNQTLLGVPSNFSEYFGTAVHCDRVPQSVAYFTQPAANAQGNGTYRYGSTYERSTLGRCTGGNVQLVDLGRTKAAKVTLGGR
ncbi:DUF3472 domain-containing protein [Streptomyces olivochromogenes]|uniref:DUF3472 domain-containing protein n=1 Tax=Streptomyces olivochromogenes TaxID=1963 RepID=UPI0036A9C3DC